MTLDQLRYFRAVCKCDSVSQAAEIFGDLCVAAAAEKLLDTIEHFFLLAA